MKRTGSPVTGEIIQIGAVKMDENFKRVDNFNVYVKPKYLSCMHKHVEKLTGITTETLKTGISFIKAAELFNKWCGKDSVILSWGSDDILMWRENLELHQLSENLIPKWYDAQLIFAYQTYGEKRQYSLQHAMEEKNVKAHGLEAHDALHDAYFTALICKELNFPASLLVYDDSLRKEHPPILFPRTLAFFIYEDFLEKKSILRPPKVRQAFCPYCQEQLKLTSLERLSGDKYLSLGHCEKHGDFAVQWRVGKYIARKKGLRFYVMKIITASSDMITKLYKHKAKINREKELRFQQKLKERVENLKKG